MPLTENHVTFWKSLRITDPECDIHNRIKLGFILRHLQEISGEHLDALGYPNEKLYEIGQGFFLSKIRLEIFRRPESGEILRWQTTPLPPSGVQFIRKNEIFDASGSLVLRSDSLWALVDLHSRRILRPSAFPGSLSFGETFSRDRLSALRIHIPADMKNASLPPAWEREIRFSDLDINRHVNNAAYADFVMDVLPDEISLKKEPEELLISFHNEACLHDRLSVSCFQGTPVSWYVSARTEQLCFEASIRFKE